MISVSKEIDKNINEIDKHTINVREMQFYTFPQQNKYTFIVLKP